MASVGVFLAHALYDCLLLTLVIVCITIAISEPI